MARVASDAPVSLEMIKNASTKTGVDAKIIATFLQADSNFGKA
jgi:membrane-bound lytic murein transglycosylase B